MAARRRATARAAVLPARRGVPSFTRLAPSRRSIAVGAALFTAAAAAYVGARDTSVFAVTTLEIRGGSPAVQREVRAALAPELGRSLVRIDGDELDRRLHPVPDVLSSTYDRAFPHTLRIVVVPERPVLLLRRGADGWVVSARGRVLRRIGNPRLSPLPRTWVPKTTEVEVDALLPAADGGLAAAAVAPLAAARFLGHVRTVRATARELTLVLASGAEVRLGDIGDLRLKLAIAGRIIATTAPAVYRYVDVSVPERPVASSVNPQVEG